MQLSKNVIEKLSKYNDLTEEEELEILKFIKEKYPSLLTLAQIQLNNYRKGNKITRSGIILSLRKWL